MIYSSDGEDSSEFYLGRDTTTRWNEMPSMRSLLSHNIISHPIDVKGNARNAKTTVECNEILE